MNKTETKQGLYISIGILPLMLFMLAVSMCIVFLIGRNIGEIDAEGTWRFDNVHLAMPTYYRRLTGCDSIQLINESIREWDDSKKEFAAVRDTLVANFCYPNSLKK